MKVFSGLQLTHIYLNLGWGKQDSLWWASHGCTPPAIQITDFVHLGHHLALRYPCVVSYPLLQAVALVQRALASERTIIDNSFSRLFKHGLRPKRKSRIQGLAINGGRDQRKAQTNPGLPRARYIRDLVSETCSKQQDDERVHTPR